MGTKDAKAGKKDDAIFRLYSSGLITGRDAYLYSFSNIECTRKGRLAAADYVNALNTLKNIKPQGKRKELLLQINKVKQDNSSNIRWDQTLENNLRQGKNVTYASNNVRHVQYRPFIKRACYVDNVLIKRKHQQHKIFPGGDDKNQAICVPGIGQKQPFSVLMVDTLPDDGMFAPMQCFPRFCFGEDERAVYSTAHKKPERKKSDNISDTATMDFQLQYEDKTISKGAIFNYIYGLLHSKKYGERFANNLTSELPRILLAHDFWAFAKPGEKLSWLHLNYEVCKQYPLKEVFGGDGKPTAKHYLLTRRKMKFIGENRDALQINEHIRLAGIPAEAHDYQVNGRTPLEWLIDRYRITTDKESGITNDPNGWFDDPRDIVAAIRRIVYVSVETARIIASLPEPFDD